MRMKDFYRTRLEIPDIHQSIALLFVKFADNAHCPVTKFFKNAFLM